MNEMLRCRSSADNYERREDVWVAGTPARKQAMTTFSRPRRAVLRLAILTVLAAATILPASVADGAPRGPHFTLGDGHERRFNLDPGPCGMAGPDLRGGGRGDCPRPDRRYPRDDRGGRHGPGSNAFGLQFDWEGY
jgi:hypothetical protein